MNDSFLNRARVILRNWGSYGPVLPSSSGQLYGWRPLPIDDMSDEEILSVAREIADQSDKEDK